MQNEHLSTRFWVILARTTLCSFFFLAEFSLLAEFIKTKTLIPFNPLGGRSCYARSNARCPLGEGIEDTYPHSLAGARWFHLCSRHVSLLFKDCVFRINSRIGSKLTTLNLGGVLVLNHWSWGSTLLRVVTVTMTLSGRIPSILPPLISPGNG